MLHTAAEAHQILNDDSNGAEECRRLIRRWSMRTSWFGHRPKISCHSQLHWTIENWEAVVRKQSKRANATTRARCQRAPRRPGLTAPHSRSYRSEEATNSATRTYVDSDPDREKHALKTPEGHVGHRRPPPVGNSTGQRRQRPVTAVTTLIEEVSNKC